MLSLLLLVLLAFTTNSVNVIVMVSAVTKANCPPAPKRAQDDCQGREEVLLSSACGSSSKSGPVMASRSDPSPTTATLFVNSPGLGDITFHVKFKQQRYDPNSTLPPQPQAFWGLFTDIDFYNQVVFWDGDSIFGHSDCLDVVLPSNRTLSYNDDSFNVTFTRAELKRIGLKMCGVTTFAFAANVSTYIDTRGKNSSEPNWQPHTQFIAWDLMDYNCWYGQWVPYASFSLSYCPCASPPLPPSPPSPPRPPSPPPPPPLVCGVSSSFVRNGTYLSSITGDVLFDETGSLMSQQYRMNTFKPIRSAARLTATPGTPQQEASISMQVFLNLPAGTQVFYDLYNPQMYHDRVWFTDRWTWCIGAPYWDYGYMQSDYYSEPVTNVSVSIGLSYLRYLGLGACTNSSFILLVRIHPPTGGDYYVGWDTGGCNEDGSDSLWPLVRMVVRHCSCPPPPSSPPPAPSPRPSPPPLRSPPPPPLRSPVPPSPSPVPPPPSPTPLSPPPLSPPPPSSPPPTSPTTPSPPIPPRVPQPMPSPPPSSPSPSPSPTPPAFTTTPPPSASLHPSPSSPEPPKPTTDPRNPSVPSSPKPPSYPGRPAQPSRLARPLLHSLPPAHSSRPPTY
ncbi:hypothetical protein Vafri_5982 [Volvox africanus]|nr:hypothetical protein Vafri_5982 [Volvox africanus]